MLRTLTCLQLGLCALCACTPIAPAHSGVEEPVEKSDAAAPSDAGAMSASDPDADMQEPEPVDAGAEKPDLQTGMQNQPCSEADARSCAPGNPSRQPLKCLDKRWREQERCDEGQRCETADGPKHGQCVKLARECIGRTPDENFCDEQVIRSCSGGVAHEVKRCPEQQHCVVQDDKAACRCLNAMIEVEGRCQVAASCDEASGGCDPLTNCSMDGSVRVCGACPAGFAGDGQVGCTPLLLGLSAVNATLAPAFSVDVRAYRIRLPLFRALLALQPEAANGVKVEVNGVEVAAGTNWSSEVLSFGEHVLAITLTAPSGLTSRYELVVERAGAQEAFLKAMYPEKNDTLGFSVALSGDTLAVGATSEDSNVGGVDGDETNNAASESGAVYVFVREGTTWKQQAYLKSDDPAEGNYFGGSVALDGDTLFVSEPRSTPYPNDNENAEPRPGVVHVFARSAGVWTQTARIASPSSKADLFGYSMAISADSVVIGAPSDAAAGRDSGAAYILPRDNYAGPLTRLTASDSKADQVFGWSVAIDKDGILIGAPEKSLMAEGTGKAVYFTRSAGNWQQQNVFSADMPENGATFGWSVALQGDLAAIGSPFASLFTRTPRGQTFIYRRTGDAWQLTKTLHATVPRDSDYFGASLAFSDDSLLIAASGDASDSRGLNAEPNSSRLPQSGAFYLFGRQADDWLRTAFIKAGNASTNAAFGQACAISGDSIAVSAMGEGSEAAGSGAVYVFR